MDESNGKMKNVFIRSEVRGGGERTIFAKDGVLTKLSTDKWGVGQMEIELREGSLLTVDARSEKVEKMLFESYRMPLVLGELSASFKSRSGMKSSVQLHEEIQNHKGPKTKVIWKAEVELYSRYNASLLCLIMGVFGFSLGVQQMRSRSRKRGVLAFVFAGVCQVMYFIGYLLGARGIMNPFYAIFIPSFIYILVVVYSLRKLNWRS